MAAADDSLALTFDHSVGRAFPIHSFIWKIASRCNLNCSYCFVYNRSDQRWREQPNRMSGATAQRAAERVRDHCENHKKHDAEIVFHGGEPLLGGLDHLKELVEVIEAVFASSDVRVRLGMQSNGLLFTPEIGDFMLEHQMSMGVSVDGPPEMNDRFRVDHQGRPSSQQLEEKLRLLTSKSYRNVWSGFLTVVNLDSDPVRVFDYLRQFEPGGIDYILPYDNYDRRPPGKAHFEATPYGNWLVELFDHWFGRFDHIRIREFDSVLRMLFGGSSLVESIGTGPVDLVIVETNGDVEAVDSLKGTYEGATVLGLNVFDHDFDVVSQHVAVRKRHLGVTGLCKTCMECPVGDFCGGGYLPNRYSASTGFDNPSIYCRDLEKIIRHVHRRALAVLPADRLRDS